MSRTIRIFYLLTYCYLLVTYGCFIERLLFYVLYILAQISYTIMN
jgi:hypothetical protein